MCFPLLVFFKSFVNRSALNDCFYSDKNLNKQEFVTSGSCLPLLMTEQVNKLQKGREGSDLPEIYFQCFFLSLVIIYSIKTAMYSSNSPPIFWVKHFQYIGHSQHQNEGQYVNHSWKYALFPNESENSLKPNQFHNYHNLLFGFNVGV